jgi:crossover junction endodeoxyribonuclease RuvC
MVIDRITNPAEQERPEEISDKYLTILFISIFDQHKLAITSPSRHLSSVQMNNFRLNDFLSGVQPHSSCKNTVLLQKSAKIILGIDPGTLLMGYSIIQVMNGKIVMKEMQTLKLSSKLDNHERLHLIHRKVTELIQSFQPHEFAIEAPFFGKNVQSMLKLGRAQGVAIAAAMSAGIPVTEYSPRKVKQSVTGNGNADKQQVWKMLQQLLSLTEEPQYFDATDALAIAVCHHFQLNSIVGKAGKGFNGWSDFVSKNPRRVR